MKAILKSLTALLCAGLVIGGCCDDLIAPETPDIGGNDNPPLEQPDEPKEEPLTDGSLFTVQLNDDIMATVGTYPWTDIKYGNGRYVAISSKEDSYGVAYSTDGLSWTQVSPDLTTGGRLFPQDELRFVNGYFVMSGTSTINYSANGSIWSKAERNYTPRAFFNNHYYCVGSNEVYRTGSPLIMSAQVEVMDLADLGVFTSALTCDAEVFNNKLFICTDQGDLVSSTDGSNFTLIGHRNFSDGQPIPTDGQFILGNGILVLVGKSSSSSSDDSAYYTTDGTTWKKGNGCTIYNNSISYRISVDYYNDLFIAYGRYSSSNRTFCYSLDGMNWKTVDLSEVSDFQTCCLVR